MEAKNRPICKSCAKRPRAINYHKNGKTYYRSRCEKCLHHNRPKSQTKWLRAGYKKKTTCEKCGFKSKYTDQMVVYFIDGNQNNIFIGNLKSICLNCQTELAVDPRGWRQGDLQEDL